MAAIPTLDLPNIAASDIDTFTRSTHAFRDDGVEVAVNVPRIELAAVASRPDVTEYWGSTAYSCRLVDDPYVCVSVGVQLDVYHKDDLVTPVTTINVQTDSPFSGDFAAGDEIQGMMLMANGEWLMSTGQKTNAARGHLWWSGDHGATWTICTWSTDYADASQSVSVSAGDSLALISGYAVWFSMGPDAVRDNEVVICEYGNYAQNGDACGCRVYYSNDYGRSWTVIYNHVDMQSLGAGALNLHVHAVSFDPNSTDTVWIATGDGTDYAGIWKLDHNGGGDKTSEAQWDTVQQVTPWQSVSFLCDGDYLYCGHDGSSDVQGVVARINTVTLDWENVLWLPNSNAVSEVPYRAWASNIYCFSIRKFDGVFYACGMREGANDAQVGLYVSADGMNWTCAIRYDDRRGIYNVVAELDDVLWGTRYNLANVVRAVTLEPVECATRTAVRCERGVKNQTAAAKASMEAAENYGPNGGSYWQEGGRTTDEAWVGDYSYSLEGGAAGDDAGTDMVGLGYEGESVLDTGMKITFQMRCKQGGTLARTANLVSLRPQFYDYKGETYTGKNSYYAQFRPTPAWQKFWFYDESLDASASWAGGGGVRLFMSRNPDVAHDEKIYMDGCMIAMMANFWYTGTWHPGGETRGDETAAISLASAVSSAACTFTWAWSPEMASRETAEGMTVFTLSDGVNQILVGYDHASGDFIASDGTNSAQTTTQVTWERKDTLRFALICEGSDFTLVVQTPHVAAQSIAAGGNVLGTPTSMTFGSATCMGLFSNVAVYDEAVPVAEITPSLDHVDNAYQWRTENAAIMGSTIQASGSALYCRLVHPVRGEVWNPTTGVWEASSTWGDGVIDMPEASCRGLFPVQVARASRLRHVRCVIYEQAGASPASSDSIVTELEFTGW